MPNLESNLNTDINICYVQQYLNLILNIWKIKRFFIIYLAGKKSTHQLRNRKNQWRFSFQNTEKSLTCIEQLTEFQLKAVHSLLNCRVRLAVPIYPNKNESNYSSRNRACHLLTAGTWQLTGANKQTRW